MKIYGISEIVEHPDGFNYICAYLDKRKTLGNSKILAAWDRETLEEVRVE